MTREHRLPSHAECLAMMRRRDPQEREDGFHAPLRRASGHVDALVADLTTESEAGMRRWLPELIGAARSPRALAQMIEQLRSPDEAMRELAVRGLRTTDAPGGRVV